MPFSITFTLTCSTALFTLRGDVFKFIHYYFGIYIFSSASWLNCVPSYRLLSCVHRARHCCCCCCRTNQSTTRTAHGVALLWCGKAGDDFCRLIAPRTHTHTHISRSPASIFESAQTQYNKILFSSVLWCASPCHPVPLSSPLFILFLLFFIFRLSNTHTQTHTEGCFVVFPQPHLFIAIRFNVIFQLDLCLTSFQQSSCVKLPPLGVRVKYQSVCVLFNCFGAFFCGSMLLLKGMQQRVPKDEWFMASPSPTTWLKW